uniref:Uncharacterized protein n=1 Tax=Arthrobotrys musiformis TaxID=47236 RepID=A0A482EAF5_9PEZI|nr:hypothetical protein [Arthrobotrys musiformis]
MKASEYYENDNLSSFSSDNLSSSSNNLPLSNNQEDLNEDTSWAPFHRSSDEIYLEVINSNDLNSEYTNELNDDLNNTQKIIGRSWHWLYKKNINSENEEIEKKKLNIIYMKVIILENFYITTFLNPYLPYPIAVLEVRV